MSPSSGVAVGGLGRGEQLGDRRLGHRPSTLVEPAGEAARAVAASVEDALVGAGQLQPSAAERRLVLVQAVQRVALARLVAGAGDVDAAEVHLRAALADRELDRPPAQQVERARVSSRAPAWSPEWTVDSRPPCRYRIRPATGAPPVAQRLEVDEVAGRERRPPPGDERLPRAEREVPPLAGLEQEVVEPVEGDVRGSLGSAEPLPGPAGRDARVVADDAARPSPRPSGSAGGSTWRRPRTRRPRSGPSSGEADPVARRLDLLDRLEAGALDRRAEAGVGAGTSGSAATTSIPSVGERVRRTRSAARRGPSARRRSGRVRAARRRCRRHGRPRPDERQRPTAVVGDEEARLPAARTAMLGPRPRLVDVAAGRLDGERVPVGQLVGDRVANVQSRRLRRPPRSPRRRSRRAGAPSRHASAAPARRPAARAGSGRGPRRRCSGPRDRRSPVLKWAIPPVARPHRS